MATETLSFSADILPLFREIDIQHMKPLGLDLSDYDAVKKSAGAIYAQVQAGSMPPGLPWTQEQCALFKAWQEQGCPP